MSAENPIDFALRMVESIAFFLHAVLGLSEPFTGCLRGAFQDNGAMPLWFWPVAGAILMVVAVTNFSGNNAAVLAAQAYIAAFHMGAVFYHRLLGHHPAAGLAPAVFVLLAFLVTLMRTNIWVAAFGVLICSAVAFVLSRIIVTPPDVPEEEQLLSPEERAREYVARGQN